MGSITDRQVVYLAMVFNSIKNVTIEDYRMHSYLLPSPQTGKNDTRLQGYCKITMQNTVGKLLEQIIATKVSRHIKQYHRFPPGLRECKGRPGATREFWYSTCSNVFTHAKKPAWLECIKQTLCGIPNRSNLGTPIKSLPIYWIFSVLYASRVVVKCEIWTSNPKLSVMAFHGSPLHPVPFNVYTTVGRSVWGFSATVKGGISAEQSGVYQTTTSNKRMEIRATPVVLRWIYNTLVIRAIIVSDS